MTCYRKCLQFYFILLQTNKEKKLHHILSLLFSLQGKNQWTNMRRKRNADIKSISDCSTYIFVFRVVATLHWYCEREGTNIDTKGMQTVNNTTALFVTFLSLLFSSEDFLSDLLWFHFVQIYCSCSYLDVTHSIPSYKHSFVLLLIYS